MSRRRRAFCAVAVLVACSPESTSAPVESITHASAIVYLDNAISLMQTKAFYRRRVNWDSVRSSAHSKAAAAENAAGTYAAITQSLLALGDHHSFLQPPGSFSIAQNPAQSASNLVGHPVDSIGGELINGRFGYVHVPTFGQSIPGANGLALVDSLHRLIRAVDASDPCGWIVDLRHNRGGNMYPMLAGVGPILGNDDHAGYFIDADSLVTTWFYSNGAAGTVSSMGQRSTLAQASPPAYALKHPGTPVAVLTDSLTASSGEAIVVAFRGLDRARSFGGATSGLPTANSGFPLSDGATLFLMTALDADRNKTWYSQRIPADEPVFISTYPATDDAVVSAATAWHATRGTCPSR